MSTSLRADESLVDDATSLAETESTLRIGRRQAENLMSTLGMKKPLYYNLDPKAVGRAHGASQDTRQTKRMRGNHSKNEFAQTV